MLRKSDGESISASAICPVIRLDYAGGLLPSVAQPPLPLQLFLALQPLSPALQPPLPLQLFWPLQACLSLSANPAAGWASTPAETLAPDGDTEACIAGVTPPNRPAMAALNAKAF